MKNICLAIAVFSLCLLQGTNAIKCYQCRSWTDTDCAKENYDAKNKIVDCDSQPKPNSVDQFKPVMKCNKIVTKDAVSQIVSRDCQWETIDQKPDTCVASHNRQIVTCSVCQGDLCNGKSGAGRYFALGITAILFIAAVQFSL